MSDAMVFIASLAGGNEFRKILGFLASCHIPTAEFIGGVLAVSLPIARVFSRDANLGRIAPEFAFGTLDARAILLIPIFQRIAVIPSITSQLGRDAQAVGRTVKLS